MKEGTKLMAVAATVLILMLNVALVCAQQAGPSAERPNIILILTDDQRWDAAGYARNNIIVTPEMNKLASEEYTAPKKLTIMK